MTLSQRDPITVPLADGISLTFLLIPAGRFRMGQRGGEADEEPVTEVEIPEFWMGETPVTQEQYRVMAEACLAELSTIEGNRGSEPSEFKDREDSPQCPVENVNWHEARVVARWLMGKMHDAGILPLGYVVDLPPESLWEYACHAGTETEYWSGDSEAALAEVGWFGGNAGGQTHRVGQFQANPFGLYDLHGNVQEWCLDLYESVRRRFIIPSVNADAFVDVTCLIRAFPNPDFVDMAALFTRISNGEIKLSHEDHVVMGKFHEYTKPLAANGLPNWQGLSDCSKTALQQRAWPKEEIELAENSRDIFQERINAASPSGEPDRVLRGGSWYVVASKCRTAFRISRSPANRYIGHGFRLCVFPSSMKQKPDSEAKAELEDGAQAGAWDDAKLPPQSGDQII